MRRARALAALAAGAAAPRAAWAQTNAPYKIGVTFPLTGPFAINASEYLPALEIARDEVNAKGGVRGRQRWRLSSRTRKRRRRAGSRPFARWCKSTASKLF